MEMKKCYKCEQEKDLNEFYKRKSGKDGYCDLCKKCDSIYKKQMWRKNHIQSINEKIKKDALFKHGIKICTDCKQEKDLNDFHNSKSSKDSKRGKCKICHNTENKEWKKIPANRETVRNMERNWISRNKERHRATGLKSHAKEASTIEGRFRLWKRNSGKRKIGFTLELEYIKSLPLVCGYTGIELTFDMNKFNTISLDRIDSDKGYVKGNITFCCADINRMKQEFTIEHFINMCNKVSNHLRLDK